MFTVILRFKKTFLLSILSLLIIPSVASADEPGRGLTGPFEVKYLKFIIDHHYTALRMTELAAGTDVERDVAISQEEGTAPTPNTEATPAKTNMEELKSMARRNNRAQREQILEAQGFLRKWYGKTHTPRLTKEGREAIQLLNNTPPGSEFDHFFMEVFSRHHYKALAPSQTCIVASDIKHKQLHRYCSQIVHSQTNDIEDMRKYLSKQFDIHDYQPLNGIAGQHSCEEHTRCGSCEH